MKVALDSLGCKLNQVETETLAIQLAEMGCELVSEVEEADIYILNTCTVTNIADVKSRHMLRMAHRRNAKALVIATGCYAQRIPQELAQLGGVSLVVGNAGKLKLPQLLEKAGYLNHPNHMPKKKPVNRHPTLRTRAFIKIQDGCNNFCSYCIVPLVRGNEKSVPVEQVVKEVKSRVNDGYQEIVLTGTEVGSYSSDGASLKSLLETILGETKITRLRLSSLQPQELTPEFVKMWRDSRMCPHFHLSLQSGSNTVLKRMKRRYSSNDYRGTVNLIRDVVPDAAITTDVIVGFPGETEEEFEESNEICRQLNFTRIHVFIYSPRSGTEAARMVPIVESQTKKRRSQEMLMLAKESARIFRQKFLGKIMPVLWEKSENGIWSGLTQNYIRVYIRSDEDLANKLCPVKLVELRGDRVWGEDQQ